MTARVMVFAPVPQLTVTIEQEADAVELHIHPGGQGVWQARMITSLGVPVTLCACLGGEAGRVLEPLIAAEGVELRSVPMPETSGWYVHDRRDGERVEVAEHPGRPIARHELDELHNLALAEGLRAAVSVLSGPAEPSVVPPDVYRRLAADLKTNGIRVVADLSGEHLNAALAGGVSFLKVSHEELIDDGRAAADNDAELLDAMRQLRRDGAESLVVTRAETVVAGPARRCRGGDRDAAAPDGRSRCAQRHPPRSRQRSSRRDHGAGTTRADRSIRGGEVEDVHRVMPTGRATT